jgi:hypothetical protein
MLKLDFYHIDAMEAPNYEPIHRELIKLGVQSRLVAVPGHANTAAGGWFDFERLQTYYEQQGLQYNLNSHHESPAFTTQNHDFLSPYRNLRLRLLYGPILFPDAWGLTERSTQGFDGIFVHGPADLDYFSKWRKREDLINIGYPRYDQYFAGNIDRKKLELSWGIDTSKQTLVYLPTWQQHSSIDLFLDSIVNLQKRFNILIKPHHCTLRREPNRMARIKASGLRVIESSYDLPAIIAIADLIIADSRSCVFCESIMADKPTLGVVININDVDEWIKPSGAFALAPFCMSPELIETSVLLALEQDPHKEIRRRWSEQKVSYRDGSASKHAAQFIAQFLDQRQKKPISATLSNFIPHNRARLTEKILRLPIFPKRWQEYFTEKPDNLVRGILFLLEDSNLFQTHSWMRKLLHPRKILKNIVNKPRAT